MGDERGSGDPFSELTRDWTLWDWTFYGIAAVLFVGAYVYWVA